MRGIIFAAATVFIVCCLLKTCMSLPTGAPSQACEEMRPYHPATTTSGTAPFAINISTTAYKPGSEIKGTIYSPSGVLFRGFLIQARKADNSDTKPLGEFIVSFPLTHTNCGVGNKQALTHTTNSNKTSVDFTWEAPTDSQGNIHFKMTIVESYNVSRYWLRIYSDVVIDCSLNDTAECDAITTERPVTHPGETTASIKTGTTLPPTTPVTPPSGNKIRNDPECGVTKGCFPDCTNGCDYLVTWQKVNNANDDNEAIRFDLQMMLQSTDNVWIAAGLSPTGKMDETNVLACLSEGSGVGVETSHNEGYANMYYSEKTLGLSNMQGTVSNGKISCSFTRLKSMNATDYIDLSDQMYLLVGTGPMANGIKQQHEKVPERSSGKVNFMSTGVVKEADSSTTLVKLHGSLMVLAWILLSSIGVVVARHFKSMMHGKMLCSVMYWFVIHRTLMFALLLCVAVACVAIFYEVGGFSKVGAAPGKEYTKAHPYLGIAVTSLTLINPFMALFRPSISHKNRPLFNWAHFSVGMIAHILAVVTIFFGINLGTAKVNPHATHVMITYSATFVLVELILEVHRRISDRGTAPYGKVNSSSIKQTNVSEDSSKFRSAVLFLHVIIMVVVATLLIMMICMPSQFLTT